MSVETPKVEQSTATAVTKPVESTSTPAETAAPATTETAHYTPPTDFTLGTTEATTETTPATATETKETTEATPAAASATTKDDAVVEATPATEGTLGYKAPGLLKQFRYVKHFFWFSEEPLTQDGSDSYVKSEKADVAHHNAAWARETGKGVLFFAKRAEDKTTPSGIILLPEATAVTKVGITDFSFKVGHHTHKFEAATSAERDSWVVAIQKIMEESKDLKVDITGRESYKKTLEGYAPTPVVAGASTSPIKHDTPKKSLDANTSTAAATTESTSKAVKADSSSSSSNEEAKKAKKAEKEAAKKERSQSRKRNSVFGLFGKKDEDKAEKKTVKEHEKEVKKHDGEAAKEEKKIEAEHKKEEAKVEHDSSKGKEATEAAAIAAAPAAVAATVEKKEHEKTADKPVEKPEEVTTPTEKKNKRASVFSGFFGKNKATSPSVEKSESEAGPVVPAKEETSAVSETAPKLDEPIATKPLDTAAVTAPVDNAETVATPTAVTTEEPKSAEPVTTAEPSSPPKTEKKGFLAGLIKKNDKKEEPKVESKTTHAATKETAPATTASESAVAEPTTETPVKEAEAPKEERPAPEKRRTSIFGSLGTLKRKTEKSPEPSSDAADEAETPETKREKSPLPSKLGGLFRKPSRAQKPAEVKTDAPVDAAKPATTAEAPKTTSETETPANATTVEPKGESGIVGDVVPDNLHSTFHDAVTSKPEEVKSTA